MPGWLRSSASSRASTLRPPGCFPSPGLLLCESRGAEAGAALGREANLFNQINMNWNQIMTRMHNDPNVLRSTKKEGLLETLNDMLKKLERIQKQLDDYLEVRLQPGMDVFVCHVALSSPVTLVLQLSSGHIMVRTVWEETCDVCGYVWPYARHIFQSMQQWRAM